MDHDDSIAWMDSIAHALQRASAPAIGLFAALAADRTLSCLWPWAVHYEAFDSVHGVIEALYASVLQDRDLTEASATVGKLLDTVQSEDFGTTLLGAQAREAVMALHHAIKARDEASSRMAAYAANSAYEALDCYVDHNRRLCPDIDDAEVLPLYLRERDAAQSDLQFVLTTAQLTSHSLALRRLSNGPLRIPPAHLVA